MRSRCLPPTSSTYKGSGNLGVPVKFLTWLISVVRAGVSSIPTKLSPLSGNAHIEFYRALGCIVDGSIE